MPNSYESKESIESQNWWLKSKSKELKIVECISCWSDVCGFGNLLQNNDWDLRKVQDAGAIELLNAVYSIAGRISLPNIDPLPCDKIIVLNDGIARTVDLTHKDKLDGYIFLMFLRDIILNHFTLLRVTSNHNLGIRTIMAGGERIQYSPTTMTGHSILSYDPESISEYGQKILKTQFLYNPAEFQMNTAFAKAFTIDNLGTKHNIKVNGLFIESSFFNQITGVPNIEISIELDSIKISYKKIQMFNLAILDTIEINIKGLDVKIFHIEKLHIEKEFDGDDCVFDLYRKYK